MGPDRHKNVNSPSPFATSPSADYDSVLTASREGDVWGYRDAFAERGFSYAGPAAWKRLPESIRSTLSQAAFKRQLKTFLFCDAFNILLYEHP